MSLNIGVVMDPIQSITPQKDSTLAMMLEAQKRDWHISYMQPRDISLINYIPVAHTRGLSVKDDPLSWYVLGEEKTVALNSFDAILMRKDPPFNIDYINTTYLLEMAQNSGTIVLNNPQSLRDANEKLFALNFPECCPPNIVSQRTDEIVKFLEVHQAIVLKPLDGMGGHSVFKVKQNDPNLNVIISMLTNHNKQHIMVQKFIPEIEHGDKRVLMINGEPVPYALARIPALGEFRGNLAAGAKGKGIELSERDRWICERVSKKLQDKGLYFVGLDIIGDYLTEVNVTSPTCIRELDAAFDLNIAGQFLDLVEHLVKTKANGKI